MTREALIKHWDVIQAFKEGKKLKVRFGGSFIDDSLPSFGLHEEYVIVEKKEPTKRLPTIEEVEQWFLDNMVFIHKKTNVFCRIERVDKSGWEEQVVYIYNEWFTLNTFCKEHNHYDGSELYITENE